MQAFVLYAWTITVFDILIVFTRFLLSSAEYYPNFMVSSPSPLASLYKRMFSYHKSSRSIIICKGNEQRESQRPFYTLCCVAEYFSASALLFSTPREEKKKRNETDLQYNDCVHLPIYEYYDMYQVSVWWQSEKKKKDFPYYTLSSIVFRPFFSLSFARFFSLYDYRVLR